ncbi:hypothetical protein [Candidatus Binatus soli]|jgi:hypothetical protein|uniref:hypothetical protein n=1 Tax=Candidatus Binatus soli TaxID=1953413 RepID=UPI003D0E1EC9
MRNKILSIAMLALLLAIGPAVWAHDRGHLPIPTPGTPIATPSPTPAIPTATPTPFAFSDASLNGTYSTRFSGFWLIPSTTTGNPPSLSPIAGFGNLTADGTGNITGGTETFNAGGSVCTGTITGTYSVNPDGTGALTLTFTSTGPGSNCSSLSGTNDDDFAIRGMGGYGVDFFSTDADLVISGTASQRGAYRIIVPPPPPTPR